MYSQRSTNRGITLIEVMVAFVILALSVTVLLRIFSSGLSNTVLSQQYVDAVILAESQMSQVGTTDDIIPIIESGNHGDLYTWSTRIEPYLPWIDNEEDILPVSAFLVEINVSWIEKGRERSVSINSIKLQQNDLINSRG